MDSKPTIVIDLQQHRVTQDGARVEMQRKPFDLLVFFARKQGQLLSKEAILQGVWPDTHVTEGSVKDVVKQLRRALGDDPSNPRFVETERGLGYRFTGRAMFCEVEKQPMLQDPIVRTGTSKSRIRPFKLRGLAVIAVAVFSLFLAISSLLKDPNGGLSNGPSIAVLPFDNMSQDPNQDYLAVGLADDLITELSQLSGLFVIARNSTEVYADRTAPLYVVAEELGVRYVLQGSVQRHGELLRVNAQLVDTESGRNLWAERFDAPKEDALDMQADIVRKVVEALDVQLNEFDAAQLQQVETEKAEAHDYVLRGHQLFRRMTPHDNQTAQDLFRSALDIDPGYARAEALLGWSYWMASVSGWDTKPLDVALAHADQALAMDDRLVSALSLRGKVYLWQKRHGEAEAELRKAVSLVPNDYAAQGHLGDILVWSGKVDEAFVALERSLRLSPNDNGWIITLMGLGHFFAKRNEDALRTLDRALIRNPDYFWAHLLRAAALGEMNKGQEAKVALESALRVNPEFSASFLATAAPFGRDQDRRRVIEGLRVAGLDR